MKKVVVLNKLISNSLIKPYKPLLLFKVYSSSVNFFLFFLFLLGFVKLYILITQSPCFPTTTTTLLTLIFTFKLKFDFVSTFNFLFFLSLVSLWLLYYIIFLALLNSHVQTHIIIMFKSKSPRLNFTTRQ